MKTPAGRARVPAFLLFGLTGLLLFAPSCMFTRPTVHAPGKDGAAEALPRDWVPPFKAHLHSGDMVVFTTWEEDTEARALVGTGHRYGPGREFAEWGSWSLPVDSVALLEVGRRESPVGYGTGLTLMASYTILTTVITISCLADPKSCFGSCPTFYLDDESGEERLVAEGFSASVARALEATDLDDVRWTAEGGAISLRVRNEALETHAIRSLRLHAVPEHPGERVFATPDGRFIAARRLHEPMLCRAPEGDCLPRLRALDGLERFTVTDSTDLAARETIELEFRRPTASDQEAALGLVLGGRHTFVSTFLFYQTLAYLGRDAGPFLASLERGNGELLERVREVLGMLGGIRAEVLGADGTWTPVGTLEEAGPLAADLHLLRFHGTTAEGPVRVRLNMTRGFWRLEYAALAELGEEVTPLTLVPAGLERLASIPVGEGDPGAHAVDAVPGRTTGPAPRALSALLDADRYLVTNPGDHYRVDFELPEPVAGAAPWRIFLESTGHYYEWMRAEWVEEESPARAALMLAQPEVMFRELAPIFKGMEAQMEESFWNSRIRRDGHE